MRLSQRVRRLSVRMPRPPEPPLPGIDPAWQALVRTNPDARHRARALSEVMCRRWPDRRPTDDELFDNNECRDHYLWLEATRHGDLATWFGHLLGAEHAPHSAS